MAALALVATGCTVGPDFVEPSPSPSMPSQFKLPQADPSNAISRVTADPAEIARWWTNFQDPTLTSLIERAAAANLGVQAAEARIRQARAASGIASAAWWPQVNSRASALRTIDAPGSRNEGSNVFLAGFDASWEIDLFGGTRRAVEAADAGIDAAVADRRAVLSSLAAEIGLDYTALRSAQARLDIARRNLETQQKSLDLTRRQLAAGFVGKLDFANAEAQVASTLSVIPLLEAAERQSIYAIGVLLDVEPTSLEDELLGGADRVPPAVPPNVPAGLPSELLLRRPDIRRAEAELHAATANIGVATAELFPSFSLTGAFGFQSTQLSSLFNGNGSALAFGPSVQWPLFQGGRIRANIALNQAKADEALDNYRQVVLSALGDVQSVLIAYAREQDHRSALTRAVDANQRATDISLELYRGGETDFLNVITAQRSLLVSEDALALSDAALATDLIGLYKALGGGWEAFEPKERDADEGGTVSDGGAVEGGKVSG
jgi:NodT family efflux transporter outer membrane factor (OMF) lipoprotein